MLTLVGTGPAVRGTGDGDKEVGGGLPKFMCRGHRQPQGLPNWPVGLALVLRPRGICAKGLSGLVACLVEGECAHIFMAVLCPQALAAWPHGWQ